MFKTNKLLAMAGTLALSATLFAGQVAAAVFNFSVNTDSIICVPGPICSTTEGTQIGGGTALLEVDDASGNAQLTTTLLEDIDVLVFGSLRLQARLGTVEERAGTLIGNVFTFNSTTTINTSCVELLEPDLICRSLFLNSPENDRTPGSFAFNLTPGGSATVGSRETYTTTSAVPLPGAAWLFGSAFLGLLSVRKNLSLRK